MAHDYDDDHDFEDADGQDDLFGDAQDEVAQDADDGRYDDVEQPEEDEALEPAPERDQEPVLEQGETSLQDDDRRDGDQVAGAEAVVAAPTAPAAPAQQSGPGTRGPGQEALSRFEAKRRSLSAAWAEEARALRAEQGGGGLAAGDGGAAGGEMPLAKRARAMSGRGGGAQGPADDAADAVPAGAAPAGAGAQPAGGDAADAAEEAPAEAPPATAPAQPAAQPVPPSAAEAEAAAEALQQADDEMYEALSEGRMVDDEAWARIQEARTRFDRMAGLMAKARQEAAETDAEELAASSGTEDDGPGEEDGSASGAAAILPARDAPDSAPRTRRQPKRVERGEVVVAAPAPLPAAQQQQPLPQRPQAPGDDVDAVLRSSLPHHERADLSAAEKMKVSGFPKVLVHRLRERLAIVLGGERAGEWTAKGGGAGASSTDVLTAFVIAMLGDEFELDANMQELVDAFGRSNPRLDAVDGRTEQMMEMLEGIAKRQAGMGRMLSSTHEVLHGVELQTSFLTGERAFVDGFGRLLRGATRESFNLSATEIVDTRDALRQRAKAQYTIDTTSSRGFGRQQAERNGRA